MQQSKSRGDKVVEQEIGNKLRTLRTLRGVSQQALGEATGITFQQIQKYEKGLNRLSLSRALMVCKILDIKITDLLPEADSTIRSSVIDDLSDDQTLIKLLQEWQKISNQDTKNHILNIVKSLASVSG